MSRATWISLGLLAALALTGATVQRSTASRLSQEREVLLAAKHEADQLGEENRRLAQARDQVQNLDALRAANRDLPRLRNEIRQLREQQKELERLRAENQRLAEQIKFGAVPRQSLAEMEGFVSKETWSNAGFATPEATLQSFFWAIREGSPPLMAQCMPSGQREQFLKDFERKSEQDRQREMAELSRMARIKGYRIAERKQEDEDRVTLHIQVTSGGDPLPITLQREGQEWRIEHF